MNDPYPASGDVSEPDVKSAQLEGNHMEDSIGENGIIDWVQEGGIVHVGQRSLFPFVKIGSLDDFDKQKYGIQNVYVDLDINVSF